MNTDFYQQATALIPPGFKGQISWGGSYLPIAHGYLLGLMRQGISGFPDVHSALSTQSCFHVRMLLGDISQMTGETQSAMKSYLKEATDSPAHWYQRVLQLS